MDRDAPHDDTPESRIRPLGLLARWKHRRRSGSSGARILGLMVDAFAGFATLDGRLDAEEADLILDLQRLSGSRPQLARPPRPARRPGAEAARPHCLGPQGVAG